ncbi:hypothetical protein GOBAR_AA26425 [Gossypium barbadense]|uniref:Uncharacterized protein n=1 Tax=Gossypium barbadense TaxID=3634 RepID=A0A2P5WT45_GOSBA|nr:hypothetical protein GOBAR_AA26425 [Gossypium barbadense]
MASRHGCVARPCCFDRFTHSHVARQWQLINSRVGEKNFLVFTRSYHTAVLPSVVWARPKACPISRIHLWTLNYITLPSIDDFTCGKEVY